MAMGKSSSGAIAFYVIGMLLTGTLNTLTTKIQFTLQSVGIDGQTKTFAKPWFGTFNMLLAMFMVGLVDAGVRRCCLSSSKDLHESLLDVSSPNGPSAEATRPRADTEPAEKRRKILMVCIPAAFDLAATAFCCIGILYIPASVWQMIRGSSLVFCAIFSITFLKRKMYSFNWLGLALCVTGVITVGVANVLGGSSSSSNGDVGGLIFGMGLVLLGQVVQAAQVIAEEWLMKDMDLPAMQIIGYEGMWGILLMIVVVYPMLYVLPGSDLGHQEDPFDTAAMITNSRTVEACVLVYLFSCGTFNATGIAVTGALSAVHRMMLDASRTMVIWAFGLTWHAYYPDSPIGEAWTPYSYMQLGGFVVLVLGQSIYGEVLKVPCLEYPPPVVDTQMFVSPKAMTMASPLPRRAEECPPPVVDALMFVSPKAMTLASPLPRRAEA